MPPPAHQQKWRFDLKGTVEQNLQAPIVRRGVQEGPRHGILVVYSSSHYIFGFEGRKRVQVLTVIDCRLVMQGQ